MGALSSFSISYGRESTKGSVPRSSGIKEGSSFNSFKFSIQFYAGFTTARCYRNVEFDSSPGNKDEQGVLLAVERKYLQIEGTKEAVNDNGLPLGDMGSSDDDFSF